MERYHDGSGKKSAAHLNSMAKAMHDDPAFDLNALANFSAERENALLDAFLKNGSNDGWHEASIKIRIPVSGVQFTSESEAPEIQVDGLYYRRLIDIITAIFQDEASKSFHFSPFKQYWIPDDDNPEYERLYSEMYMSDTALDCQREVEALPHEDGDNLERVIIPLMLASDLAHLTSFGSASVWPIYVRFGNQTKYDRAKPSAHATHHLAYVPLLGSDFAHRCAGLTGSALNQATETHCKRELMHKVWETLLDDDFIEAYDRGLKVLLSSIRLLGRSPCPRCLIKKDEISEVGTPRDLERRANVRVDNKHHQKKIESARKLIFRKGKPIAAKAVEDLLLEESLVLTQNAFSSRLALHGLKLYPLFIVDQLHEIELGIWKSILLHLIRILHTLPRRDNSVSAVTMLDTR
ncbi:hypothetical protein BJV78DRAFT_1277433 [Lactifluus subvellereus]|nr:hypothetical protein BJV78DRAFT_1277433 [Lactifluus subvellereus]